MADPNAKKWEWASTADKRSRVIDATLQLLKERGYARTTMRDIAELSGVTVSSIYNMLGSKDQLIATMNEAGRNQMRDKVAGADDPVYEFLRSAWQLRDVVMSFVGSDRPPGYSTHKNAAYIMEPWMGPVKTNADKMVLAILVEAVFMAMEVPSQEEISVLSAWVNQLVKMTRVLSD